MSDTIGVLEDATVLHIKAKTALDVALAIEEGLSIQALNEVIDRYGLTGREVTQIVDRRTLMRRRSKGVLSPEESNTLARLVHIFTVATETFGSLEKAKIWMREENQALRGQTPISLLKTDQGARLVEQILGRIAYGVYS